MEVKDVFGLELTEGATVVAHLAYLNALRECEVIKVNKCFVIVKDKETLVSHRVRPQNIMRLWNEDSVDDLQYTVEKLHALEDCGVDNWVGYGDAMGYMNGEEVY